MSSSRCVVMIIASIAVFIFGLVFFAKGHVIVSQKGYDNDGKKSKVVLTEGDARMYGGFLMVGGLVFSVASALQLKVNRTKGAQDSGDNYW